MKELIIIWLLSNIYVPMEDFIVSSDLPVCPGATARFFVTFDTFKHYNGLVIAIV